VSKFCSIAGYCGTLQEDFDSDHVLMCVNTTKISAALSPDKYTYLVISDGIECEYVKVKMEDGKLVAVDRGVGWTSPIDWPKGTPVKFEWTDEAWADAYACILEDDEENNEECDIKLNEDVYTYEGTDANGVKCYKPVKTEDLVLKDCLFKYTIKGVCFDKESLPANEVTSDGVYPNATATVVNGCATFKAGTKVTIGGCSVGCCCDKCTNTETDPV